VLAGAVDRQVEPVGEEHEIALGLMEHARRELLGPGEQSGVVDQSILVD
jgi:hypothetical protein